MRTRKLNTWVQSRDLPATSFSMMRSPLNVSFRVNPSLLVIASASIHAEIGGTFVSKCIYFRYNVAQTLVQSQVDVYQL